MTNDPVTLEHDAQRDDLLLDLLSQLHAVSKALSDLSQMMSDPTYDANAVNDLVLQQGLIMARIDEIKANQPFKFPSEGEIAALADAVRALAKIDARAAQADAIIAAAGKVVAALPVSSTKG